MAYGAYSATMTDLHQHLSLHQPKTIVDICAVLWCSNYAMHHQTHHALESRVSEAPNENIENLE
jgi:hypothetical protein